jgi:hypothetical protein
MRSPLQIFKDNIRPADLLLHVYRLLDTDDQFQTEGELVEALRTLVKADAKEDLMLVYNEIFLGLVREGALIPHPTLKRASLAHLLRQAVVASCTGLDTYLPALLRANLPIVIRVLGRDFVPRDDGRVNDYLKELTFSLDDTLRMLANPNAAEFVSGKVISLANFSYLSSTKGVHIVGRLLGLSKPWEQISEHLKRDKKELTTILDETIRRRNDIIHRADRSQEDPEGNPQEISFSWTMQAVDTIQHVCIALDELVKARIKEFEAAIATQ